MKENQVENNQPAGDAHLIAVEKLYPTLAKIINAEFAKHSELAGFELHGMTIKPKTAIKSLAEALSKEVSRGFCKECSTPGGQTFTRCEPGPCPNI